MSYASLWRLAVLSFVFCVVAMVGLLVPWIHYVLGPEVSIYDLGAPQLRVAI